MSSDERPPRRRRIAGERPTEEPGATAPRVVKRPVTRPGAPTRRPGEQDATPERLPVEETPADDLDPADAPVEPDQEADVEPTSGEVAPERTPAPSPRIAPAGRRPRSGRPSPAAQDADGSTGRGNRKGVLLGVLAVAAALVSVLVAAGAVYVAYQQVTSGDVVAAQDEAADAAASAAETILGYRYDQLEQHLEESQALMTPEYAQDFESLSPALNDLAPQRQIVVEAAAREVAPLPCGDECSADRATVLVFVDQARVVAEDPEPTVFGNRISLTMVRDGNAWLVDDIEAY